MLTQQLLHMTVGNRPAHTASVTRFLDAAVPSASASTSCTEKTSPDLCYKAPLQERLIAEKEKKHDDVRREA